MSPEARVQRIRQAAQEHEGRYLLPHRYRPDPLNKSETDLEYDACSELVRRGEARWLSRGFGSPGIQIVRAPSIDESHHDQMAFADALSRLAQVHTREDDQVGFVVEMGATPEWHMDRADYVKAWKAVRSFLNLQVEPPKG